MKSCDSVIVYCTRQVETERVAQLLRTSLQFFPLPQDPQRTNSDEEKNEEESATNARAKSSSKKRAQKGNHPKKSKKTKLMWSVDSYHASMSAAERKRVQLSFMAGRLRIVVATVAFGMGLNKSDVRAIIHYNMPKSFESYVQEIGRAGRDGKPAFCHVFLDKEVYRFFTFFYVKNGCYFLYNRYVILFQGTDLRELRRHAHSNAVDPYSIKQLVGKAFPNCQCREAQRSRAEETLGGSIIGSSSDPAAQPLSLGQRVCAGHEVSIPIEATVQDFDVKQEVILTLLCYLELQGWLEVKGIKRDTCTLKCYGGPQQLRALAQKVPAVAAATARIREKGSFCFSYVFL